eukprot:247157_1
MSLLYVVFTLLYLIQYASSQGMPGMPGMPGMGGQQQQRAKPHKKYFSRIQCQVCELAMKHIIRETKFAFKRNPKITESELFNLTDATCNPFKDEGIWITQYDIVKEAPKLKLKLMTKDKDDIGECGRECESISYACLEVLDDNSIEIVEYMWANLGKLKRSTLTNDVCPSYCKKEKRDVKKGSKMGKEPWYPLFDVEKRQMVQLMDAMPPGVQMYDPSSMDMDQMMEQMQGMYGDDMPEFDEEGNVKEKKKKKKKKRKKSDKKQKKTSSSSFMDIVNNGIQTVKGWLEPLWGDDGQGRMGEL